ncbi:MAG: hypothetical protein CAPSK01_001771 [Candidatus Accumulibacter vicinus]|uniref:Uncharacterized protein n=1 Tax=Candidatus Accumulibacter vicinus TaxID=2954382 RepID=A0A084Y2H2_9PROT|nr:MAG: hypothetical protein CAPSK01_001771 [Candidatus Accumulibacter vicinus]
MRDVLVPRHEPAQAEMEKLMPERALNSGSVEKPLANEMDFPSVSDARNNNVIISCDTRNGVRETVHDSYRNCRPKWLAKLLKLIGDRAD